MNSDSWYSVENVTHISSDEISADVSVPPDSPWFCGHFPGDPILPAIAQLGIVFEITGQSQKVRITGMKRVRFRKIIRPNDRLTVNSVISKKPSLSCSFKITVQEEIACIGIFTIEEKTEDEDGQ